MNGTYHFPAFLHCLSRLHAARLSRVRFSVMPETRCRARWWVHLGFSLAALVTVQVILPAYEPVAVRLLWTLVLCHSLIVG
jgi:hypothetical protein